jgi:hypothetical protein
MKTKILYQELIKQTLINNKVKQITFKGDSFFAKKYHYATFDKKTSNLQVFIRDLVTPFGDFYFDFTVDYATLLQMLETDLFVAIRNGKTTNFDFIFE